MKSLVWFRRDLRLADNPALHHAATETQKGPQDGVIGLYIITPQQWLQHDDAPAKVHFWLENVRALSQSLQKLNIPLLVVTCDTFEQVPAALVKVAVKHKCDHVYFNREYEVNESRRDAAVSKACETKSIAVQRFHDRVIVPPSEIKTKEDRYYCVFTPYRRVWDTRTAEFSKLVAAPRKQPETTVSPSQVPKKISGYDFANSRLELWEPGESVAQRRLKSFVKKIAGYDDARDIPSLNGTSLLSPYLAAGVISPRQCLAAAFAINGHGEADNPGAKVWISELTWRDFYAHVMVGFPRVSMHLPFKEKTQAIPWRANEDDFEAWKTGQTGYPIVDAGMRQLNQTGWMHNRLRMVTAMFLTKHLLVDWRMGERYFMQKLVDGDLAANNGGWQWSASTGTDSVPYFRIFNPFSQSKRFDVDGKFIKKFCPELAKVPAKALHDPKKLSAAIADLQLEYPAYVVDYTEGRERALKAFKSLA